MARPRSEQPTYSLIRRGGKNYYVQWWENGAARRVSCRTADATEARRFLATWRAGIDAPDIPAAPTVGAVLDGYLADREPHTHSSTIRYCCTTIKAHLADLPVDLVTKEQVKRYVANRRKAGAQGASATYRPSLRPLSDGTIVRELGVLRAALAWAVRERWIPEAPFIERPPSPQPRERWLTREEADRLQDGANANHIRVFIAMALFTAARAGALLQLTWDRVDLEAGTINLGQSRGKKRRATVPITDELRAVLEPAHEASTTPFVIEFGGHPVASIKTGFRAAAKRAGLAGVTPHVLRHTAATWMVQRNVPPVMIAAWLGNSVQMVEKVYGHHSPQWLKLAADALSLRDSYQGHSGLGNSRRQEPKTLIKHGAAGGD